MSWIGIIHICSWKRISSFDQMIAQFGRIEDAKDFMQDERSRLELLGTTRQLDIKADETICLIGTGFPTNEERENSVSAACTIRDELFVTRIMIGISTIGHDLKIHTIEKYARKAVERIQSLKVVR